MLVILWKSPIISVFNHTFVDKNGENVNKTFTTLKKDMKLKIEENTWGIGMNSADECELECNL